jgi:hypothetical protein
MKYIITESQHNALKRRLHIIENYFSELNSDDVCEYWTAGESQDYVDEAMAEIVEVLCYSMGDYSTELYQEIYELVAEGYQQRIEDFFFDSLNSCPS